MAIRTSSRRIAAWTRGRFWYLLLAAPIVTAAGFYLAASIDVTTTPGLDPLYADDVAELSAWLRMVALGCLGAAVILVIAPRFIWASLALVWASFVVGLFSELSWFDIHPIYGHFAPVDRASAVGLVAGCVLLLGFIISVARRARRDGRAPTRVLGG